MHVFLHIFTFFLSFSCEKAILLNAPFTTDSSFLLSQTCNLSDFWWIHYTFIRQPHNYEKHALRVSQVIAAVAKVSCKHGLWLVARVNNRGSGFAPLSLNKSHYPINISCSISISLSRIHCFNASNCPAFNASNFFFFSLFSLIPFPFFKASS